MCGIALTIVIVAAATVSPWTLRNYRTFGHLIPVRTGLGYVLYMGNAVLAGTFVPELQVQNPDVAPLWTAANALEAVRKSGVGRYHIIQHIHARQALEAGVGENFVELNEHERDTVYKRRAKAFILAHPLITLRLMIAKGLCYFFVNWSSWGLVSAALALIGMCLWIRDARARAIAMLALGFSAPYVLTQPIYYRYRYPVESLFLLLAAAAAAGVGTRISRRLSRTRSSDAQLTSGGIQAQRRPIAYPR